LGHCATSRQVAGSNRGVSRAVFVDGPVITGKVEQLVEALRYKSEGLGFGSRLQWCCVRGWAGYNRYGGAVG